MEIHILTIFPEMFSSVFEQSIIKRAKEQKIISVTCHDLKKWGLDKRGTLDDRPFGGGAGMVMLLEPIYNALNDIRQNLKDKRTAVVVTSAKGITYKQSTARELSNFDALIIVCGHYEGIDERVIQHLADYELSIGNYVLTGGEPAAIVIVDGVARLLPGVLGNEESLTNESFDDDHTTEAPQYTRPASFVTNDGESWDVPDILLSGHHKQIEEWRKEHQKKY